MRRVLLRIAAALGVTAAAAFALFFGLPDGSRPADYDVRKTQASALLTLPDGGTKYASPTVPLACPKDGAECQLPAELVASCLASVRIGALAPSLADDCLRGDAGVTPPVRVQWVGGTHGDVSDCDDEDVCDGGVGLRFDPEPCAARGWPAAGPCVLVDGGPAPFGVTLAAGTWSGAGCVPRVCVVFSNGGSGVDPGWPDTAPLQLPDGGLISPRAESP
jgi:hypothetical protein